MDKYNGAFQDDEIQTTHHRTRPRRSKSVDGVDEGDNVNLISSRSRNSIRRTISVTEATLSGRRASARRTEKGRSLSSVALNSSFFDDSQISINPYEAYYCDEKTDNKGNNSSISRLNNNPSGKKKKKKRQDSKTNILIAAAEDGNNLEKSKTQELDFFHSPNNVESDSLLLHQNSKIRDDQMDSNQNQTNRLSISLSQSPKRERHNSFQDRSPITRASEPRRNTSHRSKSPIPLSLDIQGMIERPSTRRRSQSQRKIESHSRNHRSKSQKRTEDQPTDPHSSSSKIVVSMESSDPDPSQLRNRTVRRSSKTTRAHTSKSPMRAIHSQRDGNVSPKDRVSSRKSKSPVPPDANLSRVSRSSTVGETKHFTSKYTSSQKEDATSSNRTRNSPPSKKDGTSDVQSYLDLVDSVPKNQRSKSSRLINESSLLNKSEFTTVNTNHRSKSTVRSRRGEIRVVETTNKEIYKTHHRSKSSNRQLLPIDSLDSCKGSIQERPKITNSNIREPKLIRRKSSKERIKDMDSSKTVIPSNEKEENYCKSMLRDDDEWNRNLIAASVLYSNSATIPKSQAQIEFIQTDLLELTEVMHQSLILDDCTSLATEKWNNCQSNITNTGTSATSST